jgi:hypothetical protein
LTPQPIGAFGYRYSRWENNGMRRRSSSGYRPGDFYRVDDITGFKVRASATRKQWNGFITADPDLRNPQDFVRGVADNQRVPEPRPEATDTFLDVGDVTADDL